MKISLKNMNEEEVEEEVEEETTEEVGPVVQLETFPEFTFIDFEVNGKRYYHDLSPLLRVTNAGLDQATDLEIDIHLEKLGVFRFSVAHLKELVQDELTKHQEALERWQSEIWGDLYSQAIDRRKELKSEKKATASWLGSITKEELRGLMLRTYPVKYKELKIIVNNYSRANNQLAQLLKILEDRGSQIQTILRRRAGLLRKP